MKAEAKHNGQEEQARLATQERDADQLAEKTIAELQQAMSDTRDDAVKELERLQALAEVNPNIRQEEIEHLRDETSDMQYYLDSTHIKLDALRVAVVVE